MSVRKSKWKIGAVLGTAIVGLTSFAVGERAEAAKFPVHAFYWMHNHLPPDKAIGNPATGLTPEGNWSFCRNNNNLCVMDVIRPTHFWAYLRDGFYLSRVRADLPLDTIYFATPYGGGRNTLGDTYCTVAGTQSWSRHVYQGFIGNEISCSQASQLSVRYLGDQSGVDKKVKWDAGTRGHAAFGSYSGYGSSFEYSFNSTGTSNTIRTSGTGIYTVVVPKFESLEKNMNGVVHVQAVQKGDMAFDQKRICAMLDNPKPNAANADEMIINIHCFGDSAQTEWEGFAVNGPLTRKNTGFNFVYEFPSSGGGLHAAVFTEVSLPGVNAFFPSHATTLGGGKISVRQRRGANGEALNGRYIVNLPNTPATGTNVQVSPVGSGPRYCNVEQWVSDGGNGTNVNVNCFTMTSAGPVLASAPFFLGYYKKD